MSAKKYGVLKSIQLRQQVSNDYNDHAVIVINAEYNHVSQFEYRLCRTSDVLE